MAEARFAALVYNPVKVDVEALKAAIADEEAATGWAETLWLETTQEDPGPGQAREAIERGAAVVIAAGGDGTVRAVAQELRGTGIPLALLPSGTGNLLARNLDLTLGDPVNAISTAFTGDDRPIDVGVIDIRSEKGSVSRFAYLVMAGFGLDAKMLANTDDDLKARAGWLAYVKAIVQVLRDRNELRFRYRLDDTPARSVRAHTIMIGNCGSLPANILLLPEAAIDDGEFDIVVLRPEGFLGWVQITLKVFWENGVLRRTSAGRRFLSKGEREIRALNYLKGRELVMRLSRPEDIELDGDGFGKATAIRTWVDPRSLVVKVPAES
ncbi:diacylglycerol kinase [Humibacter sp. BT305]|nr:diacylglycerol kinase [Humibacter sp. BT305]